MIDKNLIVHFGVTGQHWEKREEKMIHVYKCEEGFDRFYEDLIVNKPTYQFKNTMEADVYLTMLGYNRCETRFLSKKDGEIKCAKYYRNENFYSHYIMVMIYENFDEGEKMNKVEMHKDICKELTDLYERKNSDYGNSYAELRKDYPNSICIRLADKLNRLKSLYDNNEIHKIAESADDTLKDIANYAIMELIERNYQENYKDRLRVDYDEDSGYITFEFWDEKGEKTEESLYACKECGWDTRVFILARLIHQFLENQYRDEDDDFMLDLETTTDTGLRIARDLLYHERTLMYDISEIGCEPITLLNA